MRLIGVCMAAATPWKTVLPTNELLRDARQEPSTSSRPPFFPGSAPPDRPLEKSVERHQRFRRAFFDFSRLRPGLLELPEADTLVCRCEAVRREELDAAIEEGVRDLTTLKMVTRIGMGDCQGKMCGSFCADYLRRQTGQTEVGQLSPRFPLAPLPFDALVHQKEEDEAFL